MFVDTAQIHVKAGHGGNGCVSFRREKYVPFGGPDGGDGGDGGSVIFEVHPELNTLIDFSGKHHWRAPSGKHGMGKRMYGRSGEDLIIPIPPGTEVHDLDLGLKIADMTTPGQRLVVAAGGKGGLGNWHFKSSTNQAPRQHTEGEPGQERNLLLNLKLIADVGLAGLPNAGKSTLLSAVSAARPRVADYPFTTLEPGLGIAEVDADRRLVIADIPGLIEGAAAGAGLGHSFLRHIERCRVLIHLIDLFPFDDTDPVENYRTIRDELAAYSPTLAAKPQIIAANKVDLAGGDEELLEHALAPLREATGVDRIIPISGATRENLRELLEAAWQAVAESKVKEPPIEPTPTMFANEAPHHRPVPEADEEA